ILFLHLVIVPRSSLMFTRFFFILQKLLYNDIETDCFKEVHFVTIQYPITNEKYIRFLNHYNTKKIFNVQNEALSFFAIDDAIAETVGNHVAYPTIRMWVHEPTIVLGIPDSRLPYIEDGLSYIHQKETNAVIRNSGGLAVFLDSGVLNMSMIIPNNRGVTIH